MFKGRKRGPLFAIVAGTTRSGVTKMGKTATVQAPLDCNSDSAYDGSTADDGESLLLFCEKNRWLGCFLIQLHGRTANRFKGELKWLTWIMP
jgi:hypothetical protein